MPTPNQDLLTAGKIAQQLDASGSNVKKVITSLKIKPVVVKGGCSYYAKEAVAKIKVELKKM